MARSSKWWTIKIRGVQELNTWLRTTAHLLPMFLQMLKDDFPDVRLHIISKLELVNQGRHHPRAQTDSARLCLAVIGIELLSQSLLPAIVQLAEDKQWRVRLAIIKYIPLLASQLGVKFFDEKLSNLCMSWLGDSVFSIREAATQNLKKLTEVFGIDWAKDAIIPKVMAMGQHPNYLYRMTTCFAVSVCLAHPPLGSQQTPFPSFEPPLTRIAFQQTLATVVNLQVIENAILPMMDKLLADEIPNIRFNVAKSYAVLVDVLGRLPSEGSLYTVEQASNGGGDGADAANEPTSPHGQELTRSHIIPNLEKLQHDEDVDVRFFATAAMEGTLVK